MPVPIRSSDVETAIAAGLGSLFSSLSIPMTWYTTLPASPLRLSLPAGIVQNTLHQYGPVSGGSAYGNASEGGVPYPNTYQIDLLYAVLPPNSNQAAVDAAKAARDTAVNAIEDYVLSQTGQYNPSPVDSGRTTEWVARVRTDRDPQGSAREFRGQQVWGATIVLTVVEPERNISTP